MKKKSLIEMFEDGLTDSQISEELGINVSTVQRKLAKLRAKNLIGYRKYMTKSKVLDNAKDDINEFELLKLFSIYGSKSKVAKSLGVSPKTIANLCEKYQIVDTEHVSKQVISALKNILDDLPPYKIVKIIKEKGEGDTLVIQITDWHTGKIVKGQDGDLIFDEKIFKARIDKLCAQILKLLDNNIKKGVPITDVVILATGDLANGAEIYATQAYEQEMAPPKQVMLVVEVISKLILALLERNLKVTFYGVKGNHGRTGKDADPTANWDLMIYETLDFWARGMLKNNKLKICFTEEDYMVITIRGHNFLLRHIAPEQPDTPAGRVKINQWARQHNVDAIVYGHFHHFGVFDADGIRVFRGGSVVGMDGLSERMSKSSKPVQLVWGVNEHRTMTFFYAVDLESD